MRRDTSGHQAGLKLSVAGKLKMAGAERPITMQVSLYRDSHQRYHAQAQTSLLMSDFGVTPPVALLGLIKAGNKVNVSFDLDLILLPHPCSQPTTAPNDTDYSVTRSPSFRVNSRNSSVSRRVTGAGARQTARCAGRQSPLPGPVRPSFRCRRPRRRVKLGQAHIPLGVDDAVRETQFQHRGPRDALGAGNRPRRRDPAAVVH